MVKIPLNEDEFYEFAEQPNLKYIYSESYQIIYTNSSKPNESWFFEDQHGNYKIIKSDD